MTSAVQMSRSRGSWTGLALVLLGAWGGLAPFIGPYFNFGFEPDKSWFFSTGRLFASIVPGGVVLLMGLIVIATRSRWFGGLCAFIAALGGAWFVVGQAVLTVVANNPTKYSVGTTIGTTLSRVVLTDLACFYGLGVLIVYFAALGSGRLSIAAYKDFVRFGDAATGAAAAGGLGGLANVGLGSPSPSYTPYQPTTAATFDPFQPTAGSSLSPTAAQPVVGGQAKFPSQYPSAGDDATTQGPNVGSGSVSPDTVDQSGAATNTFTQRQGRHSLGQTQYPATQEQTNPQTAPTQEQKLPPAKR
jgi:hypothetical protein